MFYIVPKQASVYEIKPLFSKVWRVVWHDRVSLYTYLKWEGEHLKDFNSLKDAIDWVSEPDDGYWLEF